MTKYKNYVMLPPPPETLQHSIKTEKALKSLPAKDRLIKHTLMRCA